MAFGDGAYGNRQFAQSASSSWTAAGQVRGRDKKKRVAIILWFSGSISTIWIMWAVREAELEEMWSVWSSLGLTVTPAVAYSPCPMTGGKTGW